MKQLAKSACLMDLVEGLRIHVRTRGDAGLLDIADSVEVLVSDALNIIDDLNLKNMNQIKVKYPAIDLADDAKRTAVPVTLNATTAKWTETVETFYDPKHSLYKKYDKLRGGFITVRP